MQYIVGDGTVLAQQAGTSATPRFLLHDGQGSTRSLVDNGGTLLENYVYDAFGTLKAPATGTPQTRYLYTGQQLDAATKLYSLRARYYAPTQGRFTARDTVDINLQNPRELNRYGYTANNPINGFDPSGQGLLENAIIDLRNQDKIAATKGSIRTTAEFIEGIELAVRTIRLYQTLPQVYFAITNGELKELKELITFAIAEVITVDYPTLRTVVSVNVSGIDGVNEFVSRALELILTQLELTAVVANIAIKQRQWNEKGQNLWHNYGL